MSLCPARKGTSSREGLWGQHLELALWLLPQSFPVSCHPRPSGTTTALLLLRHTGSASTDPTPGRRDWVWTSAQEEGDGKEASTLMSTSAAFGKVGLGKWSTYPLSLQKKRKRRVYRLPRSGVLDRELPLPRLRGEHPTPLLGSYWVSSREGKVLKPWLQPLSQPKFLIVQRLGPLAATPALHRIPPMPVRCMRLALQSLTTQHQPSPWKRFQWPRHAWAVLRWAPQEPGAESLGWWYRHARRPFL